MERSDAARPQVRRGRSDEADEILLMHQDIAPDHEVERLPTGTAGLRTFGEHDVLDPLALRASSRKLDRRSRLVDPGHVTVRADDLCREEADIPGAAADLQHPHPGP